MKKLGNSEALVVIGDTEYHIMVLEMSVDHPMLELGDYISISELGDYNVGGVPTVTIRGRLIEAVAGHMLDNSNQVPSAVNIQPEIMLEEDSNEDTS